MASQPHTQRQDAVLASYRKSIDNIDAALIHMLAERFRITQAFSEKFIRFVIDEVIRHHQRAAGK